MLVLQRKTGQSIYIGDDIKITIQDITSDKVKISIEAPKDIPIVREELKLASMSNQEALTSTSNSIELLKKIFDK
ncbi:carbon storage regulator [Anaerotignum sp. MB30-C6]|uniref:carbon storage regulator n=1 Tax=Anaerotignum sp. MB30-C6 TaxID=3070814 RepID=UPI0027DE0A44|nr:carbon storage regulator [Anaerotignum sp. MB30-C6]WMI81011.1 carbon storage regulator [Anaerotignum sp. MB30-C6]